MFFKKEFDPMNSPGKQNRRGPDLKALERELGEQADELREVARYAPTTSRAMRMSEEAARAAQHVLDIETALGEAENELADVRARLAAGNEANQRLLSDIERMRNLHEAEVSRLKLDRDRSQRRCVEIETKLRTAGAIVLDALKDSDAHAAAETAEAGRAAAMKEKQFNSVAELREHYRGVKERIAAWQPPPEQPAPSLREFTPTPPAPPAAPDPPRLRPFDRIVHVVGEHFDVLPTLICSPSRAVNVVQGADDCDPFSD